MTELGFARSLRATGYDIAIHPDRVVAYIDQQPGEFRVKFVGMDAKGCAKAIREHAQEVSGLVPDYLMDRFNACAKDLRANYKDFFASQATQRQIRQEALAEGADPVLRLTMPPLYFKET